MCRLAESTLRGVVSRCLFDPYFDLGPDHDQQDLQEEDCD